MAVRLLKIPFHGFVDGFPGLVVQRLFHHGLDCLAAVVNDALHGCVKQISALLQKLNETLRLVKIFFGLNVRFKVF